MHRQIMGMVVVQLLGAAIAHSRARAQEPLELVRLAAPVRLDGIPDEPAWQTLTPLRMVQYRPRNGAEPSQQTELRVAYDDEAIFVAGTFHDSEPPRAGSLARDNVAGSDEFRVLLDTFRDNENAVAFGTTPAGVRWDATIGNDGEWRGMDPVNTSWNSFWEVHTHKSISGWSVEMRIPLSTLRFDAQDGRVIMGLSAYRTIARSGEMIVFPAFPEGLSQGHNRASLTQAIAFPVAPAARPVQLSPYVLGGMSRSVTEDAAGESNLAPREMTREAGFDAKYALTNTLTLDLTLNTDFAQADTDDQQVNLSRFSLFQPEKRQFFQERAGVFEFNTGDQSRLLHSRRIGLDDDGVPVPLAGGGRIVGRVGGIDVGGMALRTRTLGATPAETFGVLRARRNALNPYTYLGSMLTVRAAAEGTTRLGMGADATVRVTGNDYVEARAVTTTPHTGAALDNSLLRVEWARRTEKALNYSTEARWVGSAYDPAVGFNPRSGYLYLRNWSGYGFMPARGPFRRINPGIFTSTHLNSSDFSVESSYLRAFVAVDHRSGAFGWLGAVTETDLVTEAFTLADDVTSVPAGRFRFGGLDAGFNMPAGRALRLNANAALQKYYDGRKFSLGIVPTWNVSEHFEIGGEYQLNRIAFDARAQKFRGDVARLRLGAALNTMLSGSATLQYNRAAGLVLGNARMRYNFGEGRDVFVVYQHTHDFEPAEAAFRTPNRTLLIKYTYTFIK